MPREAALTNAGLLRGEPNGLGYLAPDTSAAGRGAQKGRWQQTWMFDHVPADLWAYCGYADGSGTLQLSRRIGPVKSCTLTTTSHKGRMLSAAFQCQ